MGEGVFKAVREKFQEQRGYDDCVIHAMPWEPIRNRACYHRVTLRLVIPMQT